MMVHSLDQLLLGVKKNFDCRGTAKFQMRNRAHQLYLGGIEARIF